MSLPPNVDEVFQRIARFIVEHDIVEFTMPVLELYSRSEMLGTWVFGVIAPWTAIMGRDWFEFADIMSFNPRENSKRLIKRIEELEDEKIKLKESQELLSEQEKQDSTLKSKIRLFLSRFLRGLKNRKASYT